MVSKVFSPLTMDGPLGALVSPDPDAPAAVLSSADVVAPNAVGRGECEPLPAARSLSCTPGLLSGTVRSALGRAGDKVGTQPVNVIDEHVRDSDRCTEHHAGKD